ncbi:zinc ribbon domain-containing protein [Gordonia rhizosphera]|uniref:Uncharacterized protein n=1 Tax=Gordonia rhizosphera NBRC 16068 TaxID=1108045 RepID=K6WAY6_9ACTN|nr:zinc ribbon domain-containing protein [Gordonia rhizosphera]GAB89347.1 hypothetical protein GORHZ_057_00440 [Gordonia rhizosphera NBRC 16068]
MSDIICEACGTANPPGTQFCTECDAYLAWNRSSARDRRQSGGKSGGMSGDGSTRSMGGKGRSASATDVSRVIAPTVEPDRTTIDLEPAAAVSTRLHMYNPSPVVDSYVVQIPDAPPWLTVDHEEISLLPNTDAMVPVSFGLAAGPLPEAQTVAVDLLTRSMTDEDKTTSATIEVTVPRVGGPVGVEAHPSVIKLLDETDGAARLTLDNTASNYPQTVTVSASEPEGVVDLTVAPATVTVGPAATATATLSFHAPTLDHGAQTERRLTVTAATGDDESETTIAVSQQRSAAPEHVAVSLRLEPSVIRVTDFNMADLVLAVDNRRGAEDRTLTIGGRDPEARVSFTFPTSQVRVRAGRIVTVPLTVQAEPPEVGKEVSYPFTVIATDAIEEVEATGTLTLSRSPAPITTAALRLYPSKISVRNTSTGHTRLIVDNTASDQWLSVYLAGSDPEAAARVTITPNTVDVPPRRSVWVRTTVSAGPPDAGQSSERSLSFTATDGHESVTCEGSFAQHTSDWMPIARVVLTLLGAALAAAGAFAPWARTLPDYLVHRLLSTPLAGSDLVEQTQPAARAAVLVLAGVMALGVFARSGKPTQTAALTMAVGFVGYMEFLTKQFGTGGPMYGAVLVVVGAALGFLGGACIRRR